MPHIVSCIVGPEFIRRYGDGYACLPCLFTSGHPKNSQLEREEFIWRVCRSLSSQRVYTLWTSFVCVVGSIADIPGREVCAS